MDSEETGIIECGNNVKKGEQVWYDWEYVW